MFWVSMLCCLWADVPPIHGLTTMKMVRSSETSEHSYQSTRRNNPEDLLPQYEDRFATNETLQRFDISPGSPEGLVIPPPPPTSPYKISRKSVQWEPSCSLLAGDQTDRHDETDATVSPVCEHVPTQPGNSVCHDNQWVRHPVGHSHLCYSIRQFVFKSKRFPKHHNVTVAENFSLQLGR